MGSEMCIRDRALVCTHRLQENHLNGIRLSVCWTSLGRLARLRPSERCWVQAGAAALELLVHHTVRTVEAGEMCARGVANVAYGAARSSRSALLGLIFSTLVRVVEQRASVFNAQSLANTAWTFATLGQLDDRLIAAMARAAE